MKTAYIKPTTEIVALKIESLMAVVSGDGTQNVTVSGSNYDSGKGSYFSRRGGSIWDDEEEDY